RKEQEKYAAVIAYADPKYLDQVHDLVNNPPQTNPYSTLKQAILSKFAESEMVRLDRLATGIQLGDGRPSHLLSQLQQTNATNDESVVRRYWIKRLPPPARAVIVGLLESSPNTTLAQLATAADAVMDSLNYDTSDHMSYHPQANGIIERWHRTLKAAIMCKNRMNWPQKLPMILLGLRSAFKPDIQTTSAQLVYGTTLRLPGEFFHQKSNFQPQTEFAKELEEIMRKIRPTQTAHHDSSKPFVFKELEHATHVFLRNDTVRGSLQPPYDGPFEVKEKQTKYFTINTGARCITVSIDRLKPAFIEAQQPTNTPSPSPNPSSNPNIRTEDITTTPAANQPSRPR
ncbi:hypothetical protein KR059_000191, partial [Drosophila kikkawai]